MVTLLNVDVLEITELIRASRDGGSVLCTVPWRGDRGVGDSGRGRDGAYKSSAAFCNKLIDASKFCSKNSISSLPKLVLF